MEDFKKQIAALESWHNEDKEKRALVIIAIEDVDKEHGGTKGAIIGSGKLLVNGIASLMSDNSTFRKIIHKASTCLVAPSLEKIIDILGKHINSNDNENKTEEEKQ